MGTAATHAKAPTIGSFLLMCVMSNASTAAASITDSANHAWISGGSALEATAPTLAVQTFWTFCLSTDTNNQIVVTVHNSGVTHVMIGCLMEFTGVQPVFTGGGINRLPYIDSKTAISAAATSANPAHAAQPLSGLFQVTCIAMGLVSPGGTTAGRTLATW